jgi:hypothetical protein
MTHSAQSSLLDDTVRLLVQYFGAGEVRAALARANPRRAGELPQRSPDSVRRGQQPHRSAIAKALELIRERDAEKHRLLSEFYSRLSDRATLRESQDIRHFAQRVGLKNITGKSRKDLVAALMRFLLEQPTERLRADLKKADDISEEQRQQGFSVLTDKLIANISPAQTVGPE